MAEAAASELMERTCDKCGVIDTEPHHVQYKIGPGVAQSITKHVQCCATDGCPSCSTDMRWATQEGADLEHLRDFLTHRPRELYQELFEKLGIESAEFQYPTDPEES